MGISREVVTLSSVFDEESEYADDIWPGVGEAPEASHQSGQPSLAHDNPYQLTVQSNFYGGYDSSGPKYRTHSPQSELNLKNALGGLFAIFKNKIQGGPEFVGQHASSTNLSFLSSGNNGDGFLHSSVYIPSAPPLLEGQADPPEWLPDSCADSCMQCSAPFTVLTRGRHHCRFCGGIFCRTCTKGRSLLPPNFREKDPQRVCDTCYNKLNPLQGIFINSISNAAQTAKHDVLDWTCTRGWLNLPMGLSMESEIYKAANALKIYSQVAQLNAEKSIPHRVLSKASGLAILTVAKVGALVTYKLGTGLVIARKSDGSWSAPSAILSFGIGWGAQFGGELTDFIIVLHGPKAVKTFTSRLHFSLGAGLSVAAGPIGRALEADLRAGDRGSGMCYTYSCSKGAFAGVSLEGNIVMTRMDANLCFYGDPYLTADDILLGDLNRPRAALPLYSALSDLYSKLHYGFH